MGRDDWKGCSWAGHDTWDDDCIHCSMNKDIYSNYELYQAMAGNHPDSESNESG